LSAFATQYETLDRPRKSWELSVLQPRRVAGKFRARDFGGGALATHRAKDEVMQQSLVRHSFPSNPCVAPAGNAVADLRPAISMFVSRWP